MGRSFGPALTSAETEFGGYPAWLLKHHDIKVRSDDPQFMKYCRAYMKALHDQIGDLQVTHGGPILMVQIENELGRIDKYLADLKQTFIDVGFDTQLFTCDHSGPVWKQIQGLPGILRATNGLPNQSKLDLAEQVAGGYPVYGSEVYTSWYSVWADRVGGPHASKQSHRRTNQGHPMAPRPPPVLLLLPFRRRNQLRILQRRQRLAARPDHVRLRCSGR